MAEQTEATRQSDWIYPPQVGQVAVFACSVVSANQQIDGAANFPWMRGRYVTFQADGGDVYLLFGLDNTVACDFTLTAGVKQCQLIPAGQSLHVKIPIRTDTNSPAFFAFQASAGTPKLRVVASSFTCYIPNP